MNILQYLETSKKNQELSLLSNDLSNYGLCPIEWFLIQEDSVSYKIANKQEPGFYFRGRIQFKNGRKKWSSIHLAGL